MSPSQGRVAGGIDTAEQLAARLGRHIRPSTVIVCVGSELRGDDGAAAAVAHRLAGTMPWALHNTQTAPESFLMKIVQAEPESVLLIDAVDFGAAPGRIGLFPAEQLNGQSPSTHGPGARAFLSALAMFHSCPVALLGIQPGDIDFGEALSPPVAAAVDQVVAVFQSLARRPQAADDNG